LTLACITNIFLRNQCESLKKEIQRKKYESQEQDAYTTAWWFGGQGSGAKERVSIGTAVSQNLVTYEDISSSLFEVLAESKIWVSLKDLYTQNPESITSKCMEEFVKSIEPPKPDITLNERKKALPPPLSGVNRIPCNRCSGLGIIDPNAGEPNEVDMHLQRALARVLEVLSYSQYYTTIRVYSNTL